MAEASVSSTTPPGKGRKWLKAILWIVCIFAILLVAGYFIATSAAFLKGVILPRAGKSIGAEITVADASISPFKEVTLRDLKVAAPGQEPVFKAGEVHATYDLLDILRGNIHVSDITISSPIIALVENPDGTRNIDPILKSLGSAPSEKPSESSKSAKPPQIDLGKFTLNDGTIQKIKLYNGGSKGVAELSHVSISLDKLQNGQSGKLTLSAAIKLDNNPPRPATNGAVEAKFDGTFNFALTPDLKLESIQGSSRLNITRAAGEFADANALVAALKCDLSPTEIKQLALQFEQGNVQLGELRASGPFDASKMEGHIRVEVASMDKQVLNLAGAAFGADFGSTTLNCTNEVELTHGGSSISAKGQMALDRLQITRSRQTTPQFDVHAAYEVAVDKAGQTAVMRALTLSGTEQGREILSAQLTSPMAFAWGVSASAVGDSSLKLTVTSLDLADWKAFMGTNPPSGQANLTLVLNSARAGKQLTFDLDSGLANLNAGSGENRITQADVHFQAKGRLGDFNQCNISDCKLDLSRQGQQLVSLSGSGNYGITNAAGALDVDAKLMLPQLTKLVPRPDLKVTAGQVELIAHFDTSRHSNSVKGTLTLQDFTGVIGSSKLDKYGATVDLDTEMSPSQIMIRNASAKVNSNGNAGGGLGLAGNYALATKSADLTMKLNDFNQNGLRPFLEPLLADKSLVSVTLNGSVGIQFNPQGDSGAKGEIEISHLVVKDPRGQLPSTPLDAKMMLDAALHKQIANLKQFQVTLTPTTRAKNQLDLSGQVDMTDTNALQANLKIQSDSLDLTSYYDLFAGKEKAGSAAQPTRETSGAQAPRPEVEPQPVKLPVRNSTLDMTIGRLYLRELEVSNLVTNVKLDVGHVVLNTCRMAVNGAPVSATADVDLGTIGYKYNVSLDAQRVPFAPLVDTFAPDRKGELGGSLSVGSQFSGAGITGPNLQKNLAGQFDVTSTNLDLSVLKVRSALLKAVINVVAFIPELTKNPASAVGSLFGGSKGSLTDELAKSAINAISAHGSIGKGRLDLREAQVQSAAFEADAKGAITLSAIPTNSEIQIPVTILVSRPISEKIGLSQAKPTATNAYVKMPDFLTMRGTVGDPKADIDKLALTGTVLKSVGAIVPGVGGKVGNILEGVGNVLTGGSSGSSNNSATSNSNRSSTNRPPAHNLLDQLLRPSGK